MKKAQIIQNTDVNALDELIASRKKVVVVNMVQNNQVNFETGRDAPRGIHIMCDLFNEIPPPRLNNIILKAMTAALRICDGNKYRAAEFLGISDTTIDRYITKGQPIQISERSQL